MRFTIATVAFFAGLAAALPNGADTTVYETEDVTITSCAPTVTDCPARTHTSVPAMVTSVTSSMPSGAAAESSPAASTESPSATAMTSGSMSSAAPSAGSTNTGAPAPSSVVPVSQSSAVSYTVVAHTTCIPTVVYSTIPVPMGTSPVTAGSGPHGGSSSMPAAR